MTVSLHVPYLEYDKIRPIAESFLREYGAWGTFPVDIEYIIDVQMGIDIIPLPGLLRDLDIDAFISSDCMSITVDDSYYATGRNLNRHRFSLAHEIAHAILHKEILSRCSFANIAEYREFMVTTDEEDIARLEIQSDCFAGLVLVPSPLLAREFELARQSAESRGISLAAAWDVASDYVCHALGRMFEVSAPVVEKRLRYDKLHEGFL